MTNTEEAQYSTSFPCAVALVHDDVLPKHISDAALDDLETRRLASVLSITEDDHANALFPQQHIARAKLTLQDGQVLQSDWMEPEWDASEPPTAQDLQDKFQKFTVPIIGTEQSNELQQAIFDLPNQSTYYLFGLLASSIKPATTVDKSA